MRISFDLDEVLFVDPNTFETEDPLRFPLNRIYRERLRKGTVQLINTLQEEGFEVWVYTSSFRSERYIRSLFGHYGVHFDDIVNSPRHLKEVQRGRPGLLPQKMPGFYRIDLHIDDEDVIHQYGRRMGFRTFKVCDPDPEWAEKVLAEARRVRGLKTEKKADEIRVKAQSVRRKRDVIRTNPAESDDPAGSGADERPSRNGESRIPGETPHQEDQSLGTACEPGR